MVGGLRPGPVNRGYRLGQIASASLLSLSHGTNDAQKTMGIITLALVTNGSLAGPSPDPPIWVIVSAATAIALGTYIGGWRIIRTMGTRIYKMDPAQGFAAQGGGAAVLLTASHLGFPLSTTHSITGAVLGAGAAKRLSAVRWGLAGNIALAWALTIPAAAFVGAVTYGLARIFGTGALGPVLISVSLIALMAAMFGKRMRNAAAMRTATADA
jgi:PiT family inorganic phosphate transporter